MTLDLNIGALAQGAVLLLLGTGLTWLRGLSLRLSKMEKQIGNGSTPISERLAVIEERQSHNFTAITNSVAQMHAENSKRLDRLDEQQRTRG